MASQERLLKIVRISKVVCWVILVAGYFSVLIILGNAVRSRIFDDLALLLLFVNTTFIFMASLIIARIQVVEKRTQTEAMVRGRSSCWFGLKYAAGLLLLDYYGSGLYFGYRAWQEFSHKAFGAGICSIIMALTLLLAVEIIFNKSNKPEVV